MNGAPHLQVVGGEPSQDDRQRASRESARKIFAEARRVRQLLLISAALFLFSMVVSTVVALNGHTWSVLLVAFWGVGFGFVVGFYLGLRHLDEFADLLVRSLDLLEGLALDQSWRQPPESREE